jgi:hypothetical protein
MHDGMWPQLHTEVHEQATDAMHKADYNFTSGKACRGLGGKIYVIDKLPPRRFHSTWQVMERACRKIESDTKLRWGNSTAKKELSYIKELICITNWTKNFFIITNLIHKFLVHSHKLHEIKFLYMFRAQSAHHQEVNDANCTYAASGIVTFRK